LIAITGIGQEDTKLFAVSKGRLVILPVGIEAKEVLEVVEAFLKSLPALELVP
jgi:hypothetical protein